MKKKIEKRYVQIKNENKKIIITVYLPEVLSQPKFDFHA